jgi:osmotically-inducible protein OsmY
MTKTDLQLKRDIDEELRWDPRVNAAQVGVSVDEGRVTLLGTVDTLAEKVAAEDAAKRVAGVHTVAPELAVKLPSSHARSDADLTAAVRAALRHDVFVPKAIEADVREGVVTLHGKAGWNYERAHAEKSVQNMKGVVAVVNAIVLDDRASPNHLEHEVREAIGRQSTHHAKSIHVRSEGGKITLRGHVSSWQELGHVSTAAWSAPGVTEVINELSVTPAGARAS